MHTYNSIFIESEDPANERETSSPSCVTWTMPKQPQSGSLVMVGFNWRATSSMYKRRYIIIYSIIIYNMIQSLPGTPAMNSGLNVSTDKYVTSEISVSMGRPPSTAKEIVIPDLEAAMECQFPLQRVSLSEGA